MCVRKIAFSIFLYFLTHASFSFCNESEPQLIRLPKYDWSAHLKIPPGTGGTEGFQVLHFNSRNKHYSASQEATNFVATYFQEAQELYSDAEVLQKASESVILEGAYIEAGVCTGKTINFLAALNPRKTIYGFDCFEGLPEDWVRADKIFEQGTFSFKEGHLESLPTLSNVVLFKGLFKDVLPLFKREILKDTPISLLHIDSDIYSSCKDVFDALGDNLVEGSVIVFDELYNYPGYDWHEWKALNEFILANHFSIEFIAYNANHEQVAIILHKKVSH